MDQAAADKVKQIRERQERIDNAAREHECEESEFHPCEICAEWQALIHAQRVNAHHEIPLLLSQLSASEERVSQLEGGIRAMASTLIMCWDPGYPDCNCDRCAVQKMAESLLPSPPQVDIRG